LRASRAIDPLGRGTPVERPIRNGPPTTRSAFSRARRLRSVSFAARTCPPGCPREENSVARPVTRFAPRHPCRRCLGAPRAGSPGAVLSNQRFQAIPDASGRLMQPTLSKTSTHALAASSAYPAEPAATAEPDASMAGAHFCQRSSLTHRVFSTRGDEPGAGVWRPVTARTNGALCARSYRVGRPRPLPPPKH